MTLQEATNQLEELLEPLIEAQQVYSDTLVDIEIKRSHIYQSETFMLLKNAEAREAFITATFETEGILENKQKVSNDYYRLKTRKDLLVEISKSLRILEAK